LSSHVTGSASFANQRSGRTSQRLVDSGFAYAIDFGTSSPITMCRKVIVTKAMMTVAAACDTTAAEPNPSRSNSVAISDATVVSPAQPNASEASVTPSCTADR
jgi:hypothetical protein